MIKQRSLTINGGMIRNAMNDRNDTIKDTDFKVSNIFYRSYCIAHTYSQPMQIGKNMKPEQKSSDLAFCNNKEMLHMKQHFDMHYYVNTTQS